MDAQAFCYLIVSVAIAYGQDNTVSNNLLNFVDWELPWNTRLSFDSLARKYGHESEKHEVITEDGYILTLFRIRGKSPPVLLMHGLLDSSDTWLLRGENSLGITLANSGYDVWFGNARGSTHSRRHTHLNPDVDTKYWDFSFNEIGYYDYPAILDQILNVTGRPNVTVIAHSQSTTSLYAMGSIRLGYNSKINIMISLAPICYIHHAASPMLKAIELRESIKELFDTLNIHEVLGYRARFTKLLRFICAQPIIGYQICAMGLVSNFGGFDLEEMEPSFYRKVTIYTPNGTSAKSILHYLQIGYTKTFAPYDYGARNHLFYNSSVTPPYDLNKVTFPVALLAGRNDYISTLPDVALLREQLPNVVYYLVNPREKFNHFDDIWGRRMYDYLFPYIFKLLQKYNGFI